MVGNVLVLVSSQSWFVTFSAAQTSDGKTCLISMEEWSCVSMCSAHPQGFCLSPAACCMAQVFACPFHFLAVLFFEVCSTVEGCSCWYPLSQGQTPHAPRQWGIVVLLGLGQPSSCPPCNVVVGISESKLLRNIINGIKCVLFDCFHFILFWLETMFI